MRNSATGTGIPRSSKHIQTEKASRREELGAWVFRDDMLIKSCGDHIFPRDVGLAETISCSAMWGPRNFHKPMARCTEFRVELEVPCTASVVLVETPLPDMPKHSASLDEPLPRDDVPARTY